MKQVNHISAKWVAIAFVVSLLIPSLNGANAYSLGGVGGANAFKYDTLKGLNKGYNGKGQTSGQRRAEELKAQIRELLARKNITDEQRAKFQEFLDNAVDIEQLERGLIQAQNLDLDDADAAKARNDELEAKANSFRAAQTAGSNLALGQLHKNCDLGVVKSSLEGSWKAVGDAFSPQASKGARDKLKNLAKSREEDVAKRVQEAFDEKMKAVVDSIRSGEKSEDFEDKFKRYQEESKNLPGKAGLLYAKIKPEQYLEKKMIPWQEERKQDLAFKVAAATRKSFDNIQERIKEENGIAGVANELHDELMPFLTQAESALQNVGVLETACFDARKKATGKSTGNVSPTQLQFGHVNQIGQLLVNLGLGGEQDSYARKLLSNFVSSGSRLLSQTDMGSIVQTLNQTASVFRRAVSARGECPQGVQQNALNQLAAVRGQLSQLQGVTNVDTLQSITNQVISTFGTAFQSANTVINQAAQSCTSWAKYAESIGDKSSQLAKSQPAGGQQPPPNAFAGRFQGGFGGPGHNGFPVR